MIPQLYWHIYFVAKEIRSHWRTIDEFQNSTPQEQRQHLAPRLLRMVQYFGSRGDSLPEWQYAAHHADLASIWDVWQELPIVTKQDLQERFSPEAIRDSFRLQGSIGATGGSTGEPTRFINDSDTLHRKSAAQLYVRSKFGWRPGVATVAVWGSTRDVGLAERPSGLVKRRLKNSRVVSAFSFDERVVDQVLEEFQKSNRIELYGYASLLERIAQSIVERGIEFPRSRLVSAWSAGEPLQESQTVLFERATGQRLHNHYGGREFGPLAYRTKEASRFVIMRPNVYVEVLRDDGSPCAPGETGNVVVTIPECRGTPFVRYQNGDLATFGPNDIDEAGITHLSSVEGRITGVVHLPNGATVHNIFWNQLFKEFEEIKRFQVHQSRDGSIDVLLVGAGMTDERAETVRHLIRQTVGYCDVALSWREHLPLTKEGKLIQVISEYVPDKPRSLAQ